MLLQTVADEITPWTEENPWDGGRLWYGEDLIPFLIALLDSENKTTRRSGLKLFQALIELVGEPAISPRYAFCCISLYEYESFISEIATHLRPGERYAIAKNQLTRYAAIGEEGFYKGQSRFALPSVDPDEFRDPWKHRFARPWIAILTENIRYQLAKQSDRIALSTDKASPVVKRIIFQTIHNSLEKDGILGAASAAYYTTLLSSLLKKDYLFNLEYEIELLPLLRDFAAIADSGRINEFLITLPERIRG